MRNSTFDQDRDTIVGRNAVIEALKAGREIDTIFVAKGERTGSIGQIVSLAKERGIVVKDADSRKLDAMSGGASHQGWRPSPVRRAMRRWRKFSPPPSKRERPPL